MAGESSVPVVQQALLGALSDYFDDTDVYYVGMGVPVHRVPDARERIYVLEHRELQREHNAAFVTERFTQEVQIEVKTADEDTVDSAVTRRWELFNELNALLLRAPMKRHLDPDGGITGDRAVGNLPWEKGYIAFQIVEIGCKAKIAG